MTEKYNNKNLHSIPKTIDEAVEMLKSILQKDTLDKLKEDIDDDLDYELTLFIRNSFGLWDKNINPHLTHTHPDHISSIILDKLKNDLGAVSNKALSSHIKSKKLYLDDLRDSPDSSYNIVRSYKDAVRYVKQFGVPYFISFDHDLGEDENGNLLPTGYDFAKWLVEMDMDNMYGGLPENFSFYVHSANPVGKKNIETYLNNYLKHKRM